MRRDARVTVAGSTFSFRAPDRMRKSCWNVLYAAPGSIPLKYTIIQGIVLPENPSSALPCKIVGSTETATDAATSRPEKMGQKERYRLLSPRTYRVKRSRCKFIK